MTKAWLKNTIEKVKKKQRKHRLEIPKPITPVREVIQVDGLRDLPKIDLAIKPDYSKLFQLLAQRTYSKSTSQDLFIGKLETYFTGLGGVTEKDTYGNLYVTKGESSLYPCVVAHTDINQKVRNNVSIMEAGNWIFGFDRDEAEQCGLGADDKVGVYFAVHMFDLFDNIKLFFPKDEEVGLLGTYEANKNFFSNCTMLVQLDRNSYKNDLITYTNGIEVCSKEFVEAASDIMDKYMYATNSGTCTDIGGIKKFNTVNCVAMNVSCGYINEHSNNEVISKPHFENAINFGYELLKLGVGKMWNHKSPASNLNYSFGSSYAGMYATRYDYYDDYYGAKLDSVSESIPANSFLAETINGQVITLHINDKDQDDYLKETYPELIDDYYRANYLISYSADGEVEEVEGQSYIDDCLMDKLCPCCFNDVKISNSLLLYVNCDMCGSSFNIPQDTYKESDNTRNEQTELPF